MSCEGIVTIQKEIQSDKTDSLNLYVSVLRIIALFSQVIS